MTFIVSSGKSISYSWCNEDLRLLCYTQASLSLMNKVRLSNGFMEVFESDVLPITHAGDMINNCPFVFAICNFVVCDVDSYSPYEIKRGVIGITPTVLASIMSDEIVWPEMKECGTIKPKDDEEVVLESVMLHDPFFYFISRKSSKVYSQRYQLLSAIPIFVLPGNKGLLREMFKVDMNAKAVVKWVLENKENMRIVINAKSLHVPLLQHLMYRDSVPSVIRSSNHMSYDIILDCASQIPYNHRLSESTGKQLMDALTEFIPVTDVAGMILDYCDYQLAEDMYSKYATSFRDAYLMLRNDQGQGELFKCSILTSVADLHFNHLVFNQCLYGIISKSYLSCSFYKAKASDMVHKKMWISQITEDADFFLRLWVNGKSDLTIKYQLLYEYTVTALISKSWTKVDYRVCFGEL